MKKTLNLNACKFNGCSKDKNNYFYSENNKHSIITHLILAHESSEAGEYYNSDTINFLLYKIQACEPMINKFNFIETTKKHLANHLKTTLGIEISEKDVFFLNNKLICTKEVLENIRSRNNDNKTDLKFFKFQSDYFEPNFKCYKDILNNKFIICIEISNLDSEKIQILTKYSGGNRDFMIKGSKNLNKDQNYKIIKKNETISNNFLVKFSVSIQDAG